MKRELLKKVELLKDYIISHSPAVIALSGGTDSLVLTYCAHSLNQDNVYAVTVESEFFISEEKKTVLEFIKTYGVRHRFIKVSILNEKSIRSNPRNRCYFCKNMVFQTINVFASKQGISHIYDGTNIDDLGEDRPGLKALEELGVLSPYVATGISKSEIYGMAKIYGIKKFIRPSNTCLATRVSAGLEITGDILDMISRAESFLHSIGFRVVRVRYHDPLTARIEFEKEDIGKLFHQQLFLKITPTLKSIGFRRIAVDLEGYKKEGICKSPL
jgi:uncharacterized protein